MANRQQPDTNKIDRIAQQIITASRTRYKNPKERVKQFHLPPKIKLVKDFADHTPWVQTFLNLTADEGPKCPWRAYYKGRLVEDNLIVNDIIASIKPIDGTQKDMRSRSLYLQGLLGLHAVSRTHATTRTFYDVHTPEAVVHTREKTGDGQPLIKLLEEEGSSKGELILPADVGCHVVPDKFWPKQPWTHLIGVAKEMVLFCCLRESLSIAATEKKFMPSLLQFKEGATETQGYIDPEDDEDGYGANEVIDSYLDRVLQAGQKEGTISSFPFPFSFDGEVNNVSLGELVNREAIESVREATRTAVDGLPVPNVYIYEGEGGTTRWRGDAAMNRAVISRRIQPELEKNDEFWTEFGFQPEMMKRFNASNESTVSFGVPSDWEMRADTSPIEVRPDNSKDLLDMWKCGLPIPMATIADAAGVSLMDLPEGMDEFQYFQTISQPNQTATVDPLSPAAADAADSILADPSMLAL